MLVNTHKYRAMKKNTYVLIMFLITFLSFSQSNINLDMLNTNPIKDNSKLSVDEKIKVHKNLLGKSISEKNIKLQVYSNLYLFVDYYMKNDFVNMNKCLLEAEKIAKNEGNAAWNGVVHKRKAIVSKIKQDQDGALKEFKVALDFYTKAKDYLGMGECYEQISTIYRETGDYKNAHHYYNLAMPLLKKYGDKHQMALTYNNYSNLLVEEENYSESEKYIDSAIILAKENKDLYKVMLYQNNKASLLTNQKEFKKALLIYNECEKTNLENEWPNLLKVNYIGKSVLYEELNNYKLANEYLKKYHTINDSLNGADVLVKINDLELKYKVKETELELEKNKKKLERNYWFLFTALFLLIILFLVWRARVKENKIEAENHKLKLLELTNQIVEKNEKITKQQKLIDTKENKEPAEVEFESRNQKILTESDWTSFKNYFEKAYPKYIQKLRKKYPKITDAEERLFLCIKLNLRSKETALMLGISTESVKKGRNRLRKKINLSIEEDLELFVGNF